MRLMRNAAIDDNEAEKQLQESNQKTNETQQELLRLKNTLGNIPREGEIKQVAKEITEVITKSSAKTQSRRRRLPKEEIRLKNKISFLNGNYEYMTWEDKRQLTQKVFSGETSDGKRMGVYISWIDGEEIKRHKKFRFEIRGHLIELRDCTIMSQEYKDSLIDPEYIDGSKGKELTKYASRL